VRLKPIKAMRLQTIKRSGRERARVDAAVAAYREWTNECSAVRNAYRRWVGASALEEPSAFVAYHAALDREEHAAKRYARVMRRAGHLLETGLAHQLARLTASYGSC
jgi:hypothetical protein